MNAKVDHTRLRGAGVSPGRVYGPVAKMVTGRDEPDPGPPPGDPQAAAERITVAAQEVSDDLRIRAGASSGAVQELLQTSAQIAVDPTLITEAKRLVLERSLTPQRAVWDSAGTVTEQFRSLGGYFAERVADVCDVRDRIVANLSGDPMPGVPQHSEPFVLLATDLAPADTAALDPERVRALVTSEGGPTSHTAILARALGIPAVVGLGPRLSQVHEGEQVLVDGGAGTLVRDPDQTEIDSALAPVPERTFGGDGRTADGHAVELVANIGDPEEAEDAARAGAQGVGLFRTEFCFLDREVEPDAEEQVAAYRKVFAAFSTKKVVVRTLDAGADKPMPFLTPEAETNPALGVRGYRTATRHEQVLERQLAAIATAARAEQAQVWVMAPMISQVSETEDFVARARRHGLDHAGVMVEVPSAALLSGPILARADFASIGTNDLTQYTLAADRLLGSLAWMSSPWDPAVLQLVRATCAGGEQQDRPVAVCGEAAADPALAAVLVGLGVRSLSMTPRALGDVAAVLAELTLPQCRRAAELALAADSAQDGRVQVRDELTVLGQLGL